MPRTPVHGIDPADYIEKRFHKNLRSTHFINDVVDKLKSKIIGVDLIISGATMAILTEQLKLNPAMLSAHLPGAQGLTPTTRAGVGQWFGTRES